jgi:OOP family OmpA-OmpF porin
LMFSSIFFVVGSATAQSSASSKPTSIGISFLFFDYETPNRMRRSSFRQVLKDGDWAHLNEMSPGLAITYFKGLHPHIDFASTLSGAFADNALPGETDNENAFVVQADATLQFNMLSNRYMVTPYLIAGVGASKFKEYYGAFMPLGGGVKINFFNEAAFFVNGKYHLPVNTNTVNPHFIFSIGIAGIISKK